MIDDPIVADVHRVRDEIARQFGNDLRAYGRHLQEWERRHPGGALVLTPRPATTDGSPGSGQPAAERMPDRLISSTLSSTAACTGMRSR